VNEGAGNHESSCGAEWLMASIDLAERVQPKLPAETANRRLFRAIGDFLSAHHLHPSPDNYALAYLLVTDSAAPVAQAIKEATLGGLRLTQEEADRIRQDHGTGLPGPMLAPPNGETLSDARRQLEEFTSIVEATQVEAASYGRDLERGAAQLHALSPAAPGVEDIVRITGAMLERTRTAETQLQAARAKRRRCAPSWPRRRWKPAATR
jgi:diguanylate cyclase